MHVHHDKTHLLSRQYACRDKTFVVTQKTCCVVANVFVMTKVSLSRQWCCFWTTIYGIYTSDAVLEGLYGTYATTSNDAVLGLYGTYSSTSNDAVLEGLYMGHTLVPTMMLFSRDFRLLSIGAGADEVMLSIICKYMDTLPHPPKMAKWLFKAQGGWTPKSACCLQSHLLWIQMQQVACESYVDTILL